MKKENAKVSKKRIAELVAQVQRQMKFDPTFGANIKFVGGCSSAFFKKIRGKRGTVEYADAKGWNERKDRYTSAGLTFKVEAGAILSVVEVRYNRKERRYNCVVKDGRTGKYVEAVGGESVFVNRIFDGRTWRELA